MTRTVAQKMGLKPGMRACFLNAPMSALHAMQCPVLEVHQSLRGEFDVIRIGYSHGLVASTTLSVAFVRSATPADPISMLHHIELFVSDLRQSTAFWTPFLAQLGYAPEAWTGGMNYVKDGHTYLCFLQAESEHMAVGYHRKRIGLNHLAFVGASREHVDNMAKWVKESGYQVLYDSAYPHASGPGYYAMYCEDPDRIKVEVVAPDAA